ncbi:hypothetical protein [Campylobacter pinnipediorum]|uniref:Uncharacterized protein n=1 Tax=Campylobacter pinnipediorum subsp. pinnipediorum TaxID=1660067 RepID=A0AAX0L9H5_9BACT|nr:hypothetical protein [Campylobacter pinnipediorum]AQW81249.1 hypothetical protein CPIN17260_0951 [Campylobacter pinnipediorum subsp. pinnipediorum]AQW82868.1 hypothetical protein CPIN17261_0858 [Campylobacter pinnipediorum subsp. pinnipediorum]OPA77210.1 hypothetical protein BFG04_03705 [Campylobacter pinnipediorum subsp. pinnipediorum]
MRLDDCVGIFKKAERLEIKRMFASSKYPDNADKIFEKINAKLNKIWEANNNITDEIDKIIKSATCKKTYIINKKCFIVCQRSTC